MSQWRKAKKAVGMSKGALSLYFCYLVDAWRDENLAQNLRQNPIKMCIFFIRILQMVLIF